jgi:hypothetical protein
LNPYIKSEQLIRAYGIADAIKTAQQMVYMSEGSNKYQFWIDVLMKLKNGK